jgi:hypothetical protein
MIAAAHGTGGNGPILAAAFIECKSAYPFPVAAPLRSGVEACEEAESVSWIG